MSDPTNTPGSETELGGIRNNRTVVSFVLVVLIVVVVGVMFLLDNQAAREDASIPQGEQIPVDAQEEYLLKSLAPTPDAPTAEGTEGFELVAESQNEQLAESLTRPEEDPPGEFDIDTTPILLESLDPAVESSGTSTITN